MRKQIAKRLRKCPECGGYILIQKWYRQADLYPVGGLKDTVQEYTVYGRTDREPTGETTAVCESCGHRWGPDDFYLDQNGCFMELQDTGGGWGP